LTSDCPGLGVGYSRGNPKPPEQKPILRSCAFRSGQPYSKVTTGGNVCAVPLPFAPGGEDGCTVTAAGADRPSSCFAATGSAAVTGRARGSRIIAAERLNGGLGFGMERGGRVMTSPKNMAGAPCACSGPATVGPDPMQARIGQARIAHAVARILMMRLLRKPPSSCRPARFSVRKRLRHRPVPIAGASSATAWAPIEACPGRACVGLAERRGPLRRVENPATHPYLRRSPCPAYSRARRFHRRNWPAILATHPCSSIFRGSSGKMEAS